MPAAIPKLALHPKAMPAPPRGRMLTADTILAIYPAKRSRWWVLNNFLPDKKQKDGKLVFWWEADVRDHLYVPDELPGSAAA